MLKKVFLNVIVLCFLVTACSDNSDTPIKRTTLAMGTTVEIQVAGAEKQKAYVAIEAAFNEVKRIDTLLSNYINGNKLWTINNSIVDKFAVDPEIYGLMKKVDEYYNLTGGCFDPAIGRLIDLIGFEKGNPNLPEPDEIIEALADVGWKRIKLIDPDTLVKPLNIKLNFGAIGQGYAADKAAAVLEAKGIKEYLVNVSGEIIGKGRVWKIGIQHPRSRDKLLGRIMIDGKAVATSGDYEQFFNKDGKHYSHIINPMTGIPANEIEAVTLITPDATSADALSTGIFILGVEKGLKLIEQLPDVEGIIVDSTGAVHESSGFGKYFQR